MWVRDKSSVTPVELGRGREMEDVSEVTINIRESEKASLEQVTFEQRFE